MQLLIFMFVLPFRQIITNNYFYKNKQIYGANKIKGDNMYCSNRGKENDDDPNFCQYYGANFTNKDRVLRRYI